MPHLPRRLAVGVDLDGCVYRFVDAMRAWAHRAEGVPLASMPEARSWDAMTDEWGWSAEDFARRYRASVHAGDLFWRGGAYPGAVGTLRALAADGHRIEVVTARATAGVDPELARDATRHWLEAHGVPFDALAICADKEHHEVDCFIEDAPHNVARLEAAGRRPHLIDRPWNRDADVARRVRTWGEFHAAVRRLAAA